MALLFPARVEPGHMILRGCPTPPGIAICFFIMPFMVNVNRKTHLGIELRQIVLYHSGTSDKGPSEKGHKRNTLYKGHNSRVPSVHFSIVLMHF